jgi:molybdenum cofactor cytidylyltransferase
MNAASPFPEPRVNVGVVLLGAGASSRMGRPKLLLPWGTSSVLEHILSVWRGLHIARIAVVCAAGDDQIDRELDRIAFPANNRIRNPLPSRGMFSSIQCASAWDGWDGGLSHWAIVLGDQPHLKPEFLRLMLEFTTAHANRVCQPTYRGRPRHPVYLPRDMFKQLAHSTSANLKEFLRAQLAQPAYCEVDDPALDLDLDEPEDYARARQSFP